MHDPDHEHALDEALAARTYIADDDHGDLWRIEPANLSVPGLFSIHTLIVMEQADAAYEPVGIASNEREAIAMISKHHRTCDRIPESYAFWNRRWNGHYQQDGTITKV